MSRRYSREVRPLASTSAARSSSASPGACSAGECHARYNRGSSTRSSIASRLAARVTAGAVTFATAGPGAISPNNSAARSIARGRVDIASDDERGVCRVVEAREEITRVVERGAVEIRHQPDRRPMIRMGRRKERPHQRELRETVRPVLVTLTALVEHDAALGFESIGRERRQHPAHAIGFHPQRQSQRLGRHRLPVVRAVGARGPVHRRTGPLQRFEVPVRLVLASLRTSSARRDAPARCGPASHASTRRGTRRSPRRAATAGPRAR